MSNSIIQDLIAEGVCVLYQDYRSGSFRDWSGNANNGSPTGGFLGRRGYTTKDTGGIDVTYAASLALSAGPACSTISYLPENFQWNSYPSPRFYDQASGIIGYVTSGTSWAFQINASSSLLVDVAGHAYRYFGVSWTADAKPDFYGDGVYKGQGNNTLAANASTAKIVISNNTTGGIRPLQNTLGATLFFNRVLTATEHSRVYAELRSYDESWPQKVFARNRGYVDIDPNETGLTVGYNMRTAGGEVIDLSPNGNDGTPVQVDYAHSPIGPSLDFDGMLSEVESAYTGAPTAFSISLWAYVRGRGGNNFGRIFSKGATVLDLYINNSDTNLTLAYHNGVGAQSNLFEDAYVQGRYIHLCLTYEAGSIKLYRDGVVIETVLDDIALTAANWLLGNSPVAARCLDGKMIAPKWVNQTLAATAVEAEYQEGARAVLFKTDWGARETIANVTANFLSNTPFVVGSGSFKIVTEEIDGMQCKVLKCITAGYVYLPTSIFQVGETQAAYGTWEWYMYKGREGNTLTVAFIGDQPTAPNAAGFDGFSYRFSDAERVQLIRLTNGVNSVIQQTVTGYVNIDQWYKNRVSRTTADSFSTYLEDNPLNLNGGAGDNPVTDTNHTSGSHVVLDMDADDMISLGDLKGDHAFIKYLGAVVYSTDGEFPEVEPPT